jgi:hypothetical protein
VLVCVVVEEVQGTVVTLILVTVDPGSVTVEAGSVIVEAGDPGSVIVEAGSVMVTLVE